MSQRIWYPSLGLNSYLDVAKLGWIEVADYERLLAHLGFDPSASPDPGGGGRGGAGAAAGAAGAAGAKPNGVQTDANFENLMLLAPVVHYEEFYQILVLNDFPEIDRPPDPEMTDASKWDDAKRRRNERREELSAKKKKERLKKCRCVIL